MGINEARGTGWRERARILRVEDMGLPITIVSERLALPRGFAVAAFYSTACIGGQPVWLYRLLHVHHTRL